MSTTEKNKLKRTQKDYSLAFKLQVVDDVEKGRLTYKQEQIKYGIQGRSTVLVWLRKHGTLDWTSKTPMKKKSPLKPISRNWKLKSGGWKRKRKSLTRPSM